MVFVGVVRALSGFVGATKTYLIGYQYSHAGLNQNWNHFAVKKRPCRLAVHEQNNGAIFGALIDIGNAQSANFGVVGLVSKVGQILKPFLGCAKKIFDVRQLAHET